MKQTGGTAAEASELRKDRNAGTLCMMYSSAEGPPMGRIRQGFRMVLYK